MEIIIEDNLKLQLVNESHSAQLFSLVNSSREHLREWLPWVDFAISVDNTKDFIKSSHIRLSDNNGFDCAIIKEDSILGIIGLHKIDHANKITSIGYWLGDSCQGQGFMTKACKALTDYCFDSLCLNRVEIKCAVDNIKSQAIPQRLDFKKEGIIRQAELLNGKFVDHYLYSKLKSDRPASR